MSHGAIIARDLGIPCVINVRRGTTDLPDGATIEVDGVSGTVRVVEAATSSAG
jgi:pyruvate,water dikinase